ncbi:hypothetical protein CFBP498_44000 [Xanthomonas hortorum pv. vitians]|uniref:Uncharacterized protein n=1 Tax=Xanthomonas hortorum pv. vitians TaxID=83224 RepID=A0A6V7F942_9XANT|nr:hypothetical protein CFBP498_44000 [Xanthomonas hortorum pv. vitians]CAD0359998.1 hypothetical protein CFBP498_44000 [Xanthomonas hortorum pv. vitians]
MPTPGRQAGVLPGTNDQVVENSDVEERQRLLQTLGSGFPEGW